MRVVITPGGARLPVLGQGTWRFGERRTNRSEEIRALHRGFELGMTLVDTAEMYAEGGSEEVVGEAIAGRRDQVFLVTKVLPDNASRKGTVQAAERSLKRLRTDHIDLYLLHWPGRHRAEDTLAGFQDLVSAGKIREYGFSNFDRAELERLRGFDGGDRIAADQVLYNPLRRGIERRLLPWCAERGIVIMAYSPLDEGRLDLTGAFARVGARHGVSAAAAALAWSVRESGVITIPKAGNLHHLEDNAAAADLELAAADLEDIDAEFPPPDRDVPLETS